MNRNSPLLTTIIKGRLSRSSEVVEPQQLSESAVTHRFRSQVPSSCIGPLPVVDGVDIVRTPWNLFACTDTAVPENPPSGAPPQPPPPRSELLCSLLCGKEVCGRPEELQQSSVAPVVPTAHRPGVRCSHRTGCTERTCGAAI